MEDDSSVVSSSVLRWTSLFLLALIVLVVISGITLTRKGRSEMEKSDAAFHEGDLRASVFFARKAALSYVPGSTHVEAAYRRLEAIARGAEASGDEPMASIAWDALRVSLEQTDYPGRPKNPRHETAVKNLARLKEARKHDASHVVPD
jgi:hypothetical protein